MSFNTHRCQDRTAASKSWQRKPLLCRFSLSACVTPRNPIRKSSRRTNASDKISAIHEISCLRNRSQRHRCPETAGIRYEIRTINPQPEARRLAKLHFPLASCGPWPASLTNASVTSPNAGWQFHLPEAESPGQPVSIRHAGPGSGATNCIGIEMNPPFLCRGTRQLYEAIPNNLPHRISFVVTGTATSGPTVRTLPGPRIEHGECPDGDEAEKCQEDHGAPRVLRLSGERVPLRVHSVNNRFDRGVR